MKRERNTKEVRTPPTPEEFIRVWQTSRTLREACARLHMKRAVAKVRAHRYRQRGVPLKQHELDPVVECYPDWEELAELAASLVTAGEAVLAPSATAGEASGQEHPGGGAVVAAGELR